MNVEDIKFKAYVKELNRIFNVELMEVCNTCGVSCVAVAHNSTDDLVQYDTDEVVLLPFTGFKDKNGVEIYEGDIIEPTIFDTQFEVIFDKGCVKARNIKTQSSHPFEILEKRLKNVYNQSEFFEIMGNVYENPELLKE